MQFPFLRRKAKAGSEHNLSSPGFYPHSPSTAGAPALSNIFEERKMFEEQRVIPRPGPKPPGMINPRQGVSPNMDYNRAFQKTLAPQATKVIGELRGVTKNEALIKQAFQRVTEFAARNNVIKEVKTETGDRFTFGGIVKIECVNGRRMLIRMPAQKFDEE